MDICVVTGANRGIGLALVQALVARGQQVVAACRASSPALNATGAEVVTDVDVSTDAGVQRLAAVVGERRVALLINNAGILTSSDPLGAIDFEGLTRQFQVNAVGPLRCTNALRANLHRGAKVAMVTSRMGSIDDNTSGGYYGYRASKAALNMFGKSLAKDLASRGVAVALLHPGMVKTDMVGPGGQVEPEFAAAGLLARIDALDLKNSGGFWHATGSALPW
jgi:NAD(P)-dependent dehydrogenase (short-subunit alcohol dehydrogenase family)